jgi:hypothetical protein
MTLALQQRPEEITEPLPAPRHLAVVPDVAPARRTPARDPRDAITPPAILRPPVDRGLAAPLRLTRRGVAVLSAAVVLAGLAVIWLAARSAAGADAPARPAPAVVVVHPGDTLWSIATRVAPHSDPQAEVALLQRVNRLRGVQLYPGERLHTR